MAEAPSRKVCFVTIGATAPFNSLLSHVFDLQFLEALSKHGYTDLLVQYGREGKALFDRFIQAYPVGSSGRCGLRIHGFDFNKEGLQKEMMLTRADSKSNTAEGMILSHAGSGSIMEALRIGVPLVVVPNPGLADNHQEELARELSRHGYVVASKPDTIADAVPQAEDLRQRLRQWPPVNSHAGHHRHGLAGVMADEMGFVD